MVCFFYLAMTFYFPNMLGLIQEKTSTSRIIKLRKLLCVPKALNDFATSRRLKEVNDNKRLSGVDFW